MNNGIIVALYVNYNFKRYGYSVSGGSLKHRKEDDNGDYLMQFDGHTYQPH